MRNLLDAPRADALSADLNTDDFAIAQSADLLKIGLPAALRFIVRVGDLVAHVWAFFADFADLGHKSGLQHSLRREGSNREMISERVA